MTRWAIDKLRCWDPHQRLIWAMRVLVWSGVLACVNLALWAVGVVSDSVMLAITTVLSWLALTLTMADIVVSTDVRVEQDEQEDQGN